MSPERTTMAAARRLRLAARTLRYGRAGVTETEETRADGRSGEHQAFARPPRADVHAWVLIDREDADVLEPCWWQFVPVPKSWRSELAERVPDLVLVDERAHGWTAEQLRELAESASAAGAALLVWTVSGAEPLTALAGLDHVNVLRDGGSSGEHRVAAAIDAWDPWIAPPLSAGRRSSSLVTRDREPWRGQLPTVRGLRVRVTGPGRPLRSDEMAKHRVLLMQPEDAAGTVLAAALVGTPSVGSASTLDKIGGAVAALAHEGDDRESLRSALLPFVQDEHLDRESHLLRRAVLRGHTGPVQVDGFIRAAGGTTAPRGVSAVVPTNRTHELDNVFASIARQSYENIELVLVLHGIDIDEADVRSRGRDFGVDQLTVIRADRSLTLGACMNLGVEAAGGAFIAKMDDDNIYGAEFLADLVDSAVHTGAPIVGKWAHYVWLRSSGAVVLRYADAEHTFERRVQGGAMLFDGDLARELRFSDIPRAVDSDILDRARADGVSIYSADRFNFVSVRGHSAAHHTWQVDDPTFMTASGRLVFYGDPSQHVAV